MSVAVVGVPYSETITAITPVDTCVQVFPLPIPCTTVDIDSIVVDSIYGLPSGFNLVSENENALKFYFLGGTTSCMVLTGTASAADIGTYPLYVSGLSWADVLGVPTSQPFIVDWYELEVVGTSTSIESFKDNQFDVKQNVPNPFNNQSTIEFNLPYEDMVSIKLFDVVGKVVDSKEVRGNVGVNTYVLDARNLVNGVYFYNIIFGNQKITKRFVINK